MHIHRLLYHVFVSLPTNFPQIPKPYRHLQAVYHNGKSYVHDFMKNRHTHTFVPSLLSAYRLHTLLSFFELQHAVETTCTRPHFCTWYGMLSTILDTDYSLKLTHFSPFFLLFNICNSEMLGVISILLESDKPLPSTACNLSYVSTTTHVMLTNSYLPLLHYFLICNDWLRKR